MNIFYLDKDPSVSASMHLDKHVVKMCTEYAQLLSTAHRLLDGELYIGRTKNNHKIKRWKLHDERENNLYKAGHVNHTSAVWARVSRSNYYYLYFLYMATLAEYTYRYGKIHGASKPSLWLQRAPHNLCDKKGLTEMPQCMPEYCKVPGNPIKAYHTYYIHEKKSFATWKGKVNGRKQPEWYIFS